MELFRSGVIASPSSMIIGGLRRRPHETHFTFEEALNAALGLGAREIYLTHICHEHSHAQIEEFCRNFMGSRREGAEAHPAWDGLEIVL
jgi:phosphoribosyl 1,2-cyclic phosphate phosphodiesterase